MIEEKNPGIRRVKHKQSGFWRIDEARHKMNNDVVLKIDRYSNYSSSKEDIKTRIKWG